jgi:hypothetical protein
VLGGGAIAAGLPLLIGAGIPISLLNIGTQAYTIYNARVRQQRVVHRVPVQRSPTGEELLIRRKHLSGATLEPGSDGDVGLWLKLDPKPYRHAWKKPASGWLEANTQPLHIAGEEARRVLTRAMSDYNAQGAKQDEVKRALKLIEDAGGPDAFARRAAESRAGITLQAARARKTKPYTMRQIAGTFKGEILPVEKHRNVFISPYEGGLPRIDALALEMALNEESERQALEGELASLEAAWREAEEIAHIADQLPDVPAPDRLRSGDQQQE